MRIAVSCVPFDRGRSGIAVYMRNLVAELRAAGHELTLVVEPGCSGFFPGFETVELPAWTARPAASMLYHLFRLPFRIRRGGWECFVVAAANRRALAFCRIPEVCVVHDLSQYHVKAKYDRFRTFYIKHLLPFFVRKADAVVAISRSTRADLIKFWKVDPARITVCLNGFTTMAAAPSGGWLSRLGLKPGRYILYVSRLEHPGKNHVNLIAAYEKLGGELAAEYPLVIAGADWNGAEAVHARAEASPLRDRIIFAGFIPDGEMREAYENAGCYVFPSFFEGFGLSLIEAMNYSVPCCCSNNSSLGEIGEGAALTFPPDDPSAIADAMRRILTDAELRKQLIAAGLERAAQFSWAKHALEVAAVCEQAVSRRRAERP